MQITALCYVSMSELGRVIDNFSYDWIDENRNEFLDMLFSVGMNVKEPIDEQVNINHRNRFDEVVVCTRWVGNERTDRDWVNSGHASQSAIDKSKNNKLIIDLYRQKDQVE